MKKTVYFSLAILLIVLASSFKLPGINQDNASFLNSVDIDGKAIFNANGCVACHNLTVKTVGPSVAEIAKVYKNKKEDLMKFLIGEKEAIIDPALYPIMKPQLSTIKNMNNAKKNALIDYMLMANSTTMD